MLAPSTHPYPGPQLPLYATQEQLLTMGAPTRQKYRAVVAENAALKAELDEIKGRFATEFKTFVELKALAAVQEAEASMTFSGQHLSAVRLPRPQGTQRDHPRAFKDEPVDDAYPGVNTGVHIYPAASAMWGESVLNLGAAERNKYCKEHNLSGPAIANLKKASRLYKQNIARNKYRKMKRAKERGQSENRLPAHPIRFFKGYA